MYKNIILLLVLASWSLIAFTQNDYVKISKDDISQTELRVAITLAEKILLGQKSGELYFPTEQEAIPEVVKGLTENVQTSSYETIQSIFGDYKSIKFAEAWSMKTNQGEYTIYRFRGNFTNGDAKPEVRVVLDSSTKLAGLWVKPWEDDMLGNP